MKQFVLAWTLVCVCLLSCLSGNASAAAPTGYPGVPYTVNGTTYNDFIVYQNNEGYWSALYIDCNNFSWNGYTCGEHHDYPLVLESDDYHGGVIGFPHYPEWTVALVYYNNAWINATDISNWYDYFRNTFDTSKPLADDIFVSTLNLIYHGTHDYQSNYGGLNITTDPTTIYSISPPPSQISPTFLSFPLAGHNTPYTAQVSAIMDHSMTSSYAKNSTIVAFNGEIGDVGNGCFCYSTNSSCDSSNYASCAVAGFRNAEHSNFLSGVINYIGSYLYYNGHPGYDYPIPANTPIYAAADGEAHIPESFPGVSNAQNYNTIEIDHKNGYKTYYMHLNSHNAKENQPVIGGKTIIGYSGDIGLTKSGKGHTGSFHLHFEVQKQVNGNGIPVDPYGWQGAGLDPYLRAQNEELWIPPPISVGANSAFTSIQGAYDSVTKNGQSLLLQEQAFPEYLVFSKNLTVKLQGGYDPNYQTKSGWTIINGSLSINSGSVQVDGICIK